MVCSSMWRFYLLLVFFTSVVLVVQGSVGPPILYNSSQPGPALFSWNLSDVDTRLLTVVTSPGEEDVLHFNGNRNYSISSHYKDRIVNVSLTNDRIQFSLTDVTRNDAGNYTCREGDHKIGPYISKCGQMLHYLDKSSMVLMPNASISKQIRKGQTLTLTCVVEVTSLPLPPLSWTFQPSASTPPPPPPPPQQLQETGNTLTLGPLTRNDSGLYSCQANSVAGQSSLNLTVIVYPTVKIVLQSDDKDLELREGQSLTLICLVEAASPPVPSHGFSWTFQPSASSHSPPPQQLQETGNKLTLNPLTRKDSGLYRCRARNDQDLEGEFPPGEDSINLIVVDKSSAALMPNESISMPTREETPYYTATITLVVLILAIIVSVILGLGISYYARKKKLWCFRREQGKEEECVPMK